MCESSIFVIIRSGYRPCLYAYLVDKGTEALEVPSAGSQSALTRAYSQSLGFIVVPQIYYGVAILKLIVKQCSSIVWNLILVSSELRASWTTASALLMVLKACLLRSQALLCEVN